MWLFTTVKQLAGSYNTGEKWLPSTNHHHQSTSTNHHQPTIPERGEEPPEPGSALSEFDSPNFTPNFVHLYRAVWPYPFLCVLRISPDTSLPVLYRLSLPPSLRPYCSVSISSIFCPCCPAAPSVQLPVTSLGYFCHLCQAISNPWLGAQDPHSRVSTFLHFHR